MEAVVWQMKLLCPRTASAAAPLLRLASVANRSTRLLRVSTTKILPLVGPIAMPVEISIPVGLVALVEALKSLWPSGMAITITSNVPTIAPRCTAVRHMGSSFLCEGTYHPELFPGVDGHLLQRRYSSTRCRVSCTVLITLNFSPGMERPSIIEVIQYHKILSVRCSDTP